jgi:hypothetical protein
MSAYASAAEVEFRHEQTRAQIQCGSGNRRNGGDRRRAKCGHRRGGGIRRPRRIDSLGSLSQTLGEVDPLPIDITAPAQREIDVAEAWWLENRIAAPDAIGEEFSAMIAILARNPNFGRRATNVKMQHVRRIRLPRVGYEVYYRVRGKPQFLEVMAFWHVRRGKGPPI